MTADSNTIIHATVQAPLNPLLEAPLNKPIAVLASTSVLQRITAVFLNCSLEGSLILSFLGICHFTYTHTKNLTAILVTTLASCAACHVIFIANKLNLFIMSRLLKTRLSYVGLVLQGLWIAYFIWKVALPMLKKTKPQNTPEVTITPPPTTPTKPASNSSTPPPSPNTQKQSYETHFLGCFNDKKKTLKGLALVKALFEEKQALYQKHSADTALIDQAFDTLKDGTAKDAFILSEQICNEEFTKASANLSEIAPKPASSSFQSSDAYLSPSQEKTTRLISIAQDLVTYFPQQKELIEKNLKQQFQELFKEIYKQCPDSNNTRLAIVKYLQGEKDKLLQGVSTRNDTLIKAAFEEFSNQHPLVFKLDASSCEIVFEKALIANGINIDKVRGLIQIAVELKTNFQTTSNIATIVDAEFEKRYIKLFEAIKEEKNISPNASDSIENEQKKIMEAFPSKDHQQLISASFNAYIQNKTPNPTPQSSSSQTPSVASQPSTPKVQLSSAPASKALYILILKAIAANAVEKLTLAINNFHSSITQSASKLKSLAKDASDASNLTLSTITSLGMTQEGIRKTLEDYNNQKEKHLFCVRLQ